LFINNPIAGQRRKTSYRLLMPFHPQVFNSLCPITTAFQFRLHYGIGILLSKFLMRFNSILVPRIE
jgi:hypothetical protein